MSVAWSASRAVASGEFGVWAVSPTGGWYVGDLVAATAAAPTTAYDAAPQRAGRHAATDVVVMYRPTAGSGAWGPGGYSPGTFAVTAAAVFSLTVTAPTGTAGSYAQGIPCRHLDDQPARSPAASSASGWSSSTRRLVRGRPRGRRTAAPRLQPDLPLNVPVDTGYRRFVFYRATAGSGAWGLGAFSPGTVDVTAAPPSSRSPSPPPPARTGSYAQGDALPVTWTTNAAVATRRVQPLGGELQLRRLVRGQRSTPPPTPPARHSYATRSPSTCPPTAATDVFVYYRATSGDPWGIYGMQPRARST